MSARGKPQELMPQADRRWLFASAVLDERTLELKVDGAPVELERKSLQVLLHLLNHAGELVTKEEMLAAVWPGRILSDSVITSCLARVRDALQDDTQGIIKTVHGFGYRLIAPVKVEASPSTAPARFEFKPGEHLPARPLWSLVERLGTGAHGEAWLARHDKTHEKRVYKFAADAGALTLLKREITIYRLLHDALGDRPDIIHLLDWNVEEPPTFVEYDYCEAGSLVTWANAQGGIDRVPLQLRIEIAAQIAAALGAAHSVGVLHKDLKPSNILVEPREGKAPQIKLCDFGSGGVLDVGKLEAMGITRLGFTRTLTSFAAPAGTPLYLAPEVVGGQPFTVRADIYSLGVILYQLAVGNFLKPMAPGWEQDVADELLREDIAGAADGHPEQRLADASRLAARLRALDERRRLRASERAAQAAAARQGLEVERMKARRKWARVAIATLVIGVTTSLLLYVDARRARDAAAEAAATSRAVSDFLGQDLFAQIGSDERPLRDVTVKEILDAGARRVEKRFAGRPDAAAEVHLALGQSYVAMDDAAAAEANLDRALELLSGTEGEGSEVAVDAAAKLVVVKNAVGRLADFLPRAEATLRAGQARLGSAHPKVLRLSQQLALGHHYQARWSAAVAQIRGLIAAAESSPEPDQRFLGASEIIASRSLLLMADYAGAEAALRRAMARLVPVLGEKHLQVAQARALLGDVLMELGRHVEADTELAKAEAAAADWAPSEKAAYLQRVRILRARLQGLQGDLAGAAAALEPLVLARASYTGAEADRSFVYRRPLAEIYARQNRLADAATQLELAVRSAESSEGPGDPVTGRTRLELAEIYRRQGRLDAARKELAAVEDRMWELLPERHPIVAERRHLEGMLAAAAGQQAAARQALLEAYEICRFRYGDQHWRTQDALRELNSLSVASKGP